jgi:hypothetical protein
VGAAITVAALLFIGTATLVPVRGAYPVGGSAYCVICGDFGGTDFVLNVILFVPLGIGLRLAGVTTRATGAVAFLATLFVETMQLTLIAGRDSSLGDLLSNTTGGVVGALLVAGWRTILLPEPRRAAARARAAAALWLLLAVATAVSTTLWSPGPETLYRRAAWGRRVGWFPGRIVRVAANDAEIATEPGGDDGRFAVPAGVRVGGPVRI